MSNVDGSGRKINIIVHTEGIKIEAGCFGGTLDEFCEKAASEGKTRYARVVRAAAEALQADVIDKGITGGWDGDSDCAAAARATGAKHESAAQRARSACSTSPHTIQTSIATPSATKKFFKSAIFVALVVALIFVFWKF